MRFAITGSTGLIGSTLTAYLRQQGHEVTRVVRSFGGLPATERAVVWHPDKGAIEAQGLEGHDVAIHLAGETIAGIWTDAKKRRIRESRVHGTSLLASTLAGLQQRPHTLFSASAMGIYGDRDNEMVDEDSPTGTGFLADVARAWEAAAAPAGGAGIRVVNMRFGNVLSSSGGLLGVLAPLFRLGLGTRFGDGSQYWPWIAAEDIGPAVLHLLEHREVRGPVNFVAPQTVTNAEFTDTLAGVLGRPSFLRVPALAARLAPGGLADEMLLGGARISPRRLLESGYGFRQPFLRSALQELLR